MYSNSFLNDNSNSSNSNPKQFGKYSPFRMRKKLEGEDEENWKRGKREENGPSSPTNHNNDSNNLGLSFSPTNATAKRVLFVKPSQIETNKPREVKVFQPTIATSSVQSVATAPHVSVAKTEMPSTSVAPTIIAPKTQNTPILLNQPKEFTGTKFMNYSNLTILLENVHKILLEKSDFSVIGVLGTQQVGKSTILNLLSSSTTENTNGSFKVNMAGNFASAPLNPTLDIVQEIKNETLGIDLYVTNDRSIFLDTQALFSPYLLSQQIATDNLVNGNTTMSNSSDLFSLQSNLELVSLQIGLLLFQICHVVIVVMDQVHDVRMLQFIQTVRTLQKTILQQETPSVEIVFVYNKIPLNRYFSIQNEIQEFLDQFFAYSDISKNTKVFLSKQNSAQKEHVNWYLFPLIDISHSSKQQQQQLMDQYQGLKFQNQVLSIPKRFTTLNTSIVTKTERDWLQNACRTWDMIQKSTVLMEYQKKSQVKMVG